MQIHKYIYNKGEHNTNTTTTNIFNILNYYEGKYKTTENAIVL